MRMLLDISLELGPPAEVVRYFEIVKEKWPDEEIPFAKIMKVGAAYHDMGECERSYLVFRATVESSFVRDSGVAGFLEEQGQFLRSVDVLSRLLREYPPEGYIAEATLRPGAARLRQGARGWPPTPAARRRPPQPRRARDRRPVDGILQAVAMTSAATASTAWRDGSSQRNCAAEGQPRGLGPPGVARCWRRS